MSLQSITSFACLLPIVVVFYLLPGRFRASYLLMVSYAFYFTFSRLWPFLLAAETLLTFFLAGRMARAIAPAARRALLLAGAGALVGVLVLARLEGAFPGVFTGTLDLWLPVGLSYFTLRQLGYLADVASDPTAHEPSLVRFALFVAFFPQLVSGPIERSSKFLPQLNDPAFKRSDFAAVERGCGLILAGLFQKLVLANRLALFVAEADARPERWSALVLLGSRYGYLLQVFVDLAGYTSLALGLGLLFGVQGPENFNAPFAAANIQEFWSRWHMSLTHWLMDYVYTPLRMALRRWKRAGVLAALMVTMLLIGLWHGASLGYLVFGLLHGAFFSITALTSDARDRFFERHATLGRARAFAGVLITFHWVAFVQVLASAPSVRDGLHLLARIAHPTATAASAPFPRELWLPALVSGVAALALGAGLLRGVRARLSFVPNWIAYAVALLIIVLLSTESRSFVYEQF